MRVNKAPVTLRRLINPTTNINVWKPIDGVFTPESIESGFTLFDTTNLYPLFWDGTYKIGGLSIKPMLHNQEYLDSTYRDTLNTKITNHYMDYRIGFETPQLFAHHFNTLLNEIMPEYNTKYRILWQYFAEKLPYGYFKHLEMNGGNKNTYGATVTNKYGDIDMFDWSGSLTGQNANDPTTQTGYNFDTPQNINDIDTNSPAHMSSADTGKSHTGETYTQNGRITVDNQIPQLEVSEDAPTGKTKHGEDKTTNGGSDSFSYENRYDEEYGYTTQDLKLISDFSNELSNIDLQIINKLRDCFLYVY